MSEAELDMAILLFAYEIDAPHVGFGDESEQIYKFISKEEFLSYLEESHCGDCVSLPAPCIRCFAEQIKHEAVWLITQQKLRRGDNVF